MATQNQNSIFMIGWEYPPHNSGGLGEACAGLTQALAQGGHQIYFTLPYKINHTVEHMQMLGCYDPAWQTEPGQPPFASYSSRLPMSASEIEKEILGTLPESELENRVSEYAEYVSQTAQMKQNSFELIHAHDWMSFPAAIKMKEELGKPFIAHIHSTEFDRIPHGSGSTYIVHTEYQGVQQADKVIAVSHYTKQVLIDKYGVDPNKIEVVHNGIDPVEQSSVDFVNFAPDRPVIVFMGRLTMQKGAEYFIDLAQKVLSHRKDALFIVAGHGDMYQSLLFKTAGNKLSTAVLFSGFVRGRERDMLLDRANIFVMPSLSEPFGLVALEAAQRHTPVVMSSNSGVKEVLQGSVVADFWDVNKMSDEILRLLEDRAYHEQVTRQQLTSLQTVTWKRAAHRVRSVYQRLLGR